MIKVEPRHYVNYVNFRGRVESRPNYDSKGDTFDTFTGLKDKRALLADIGRKMYKKEDISIGMFDLDNFKSVNELLGYKVGDEFIKAISEDISTVAEKHKIDAYRFGGDEFVVLLFGNTPQKEKEDIINEIIGSVSKNPVIQSKSDDYMQNAQAFLEAYERDNNKVNAIYEANTRYSILSEIWNNSTIARDDPYIQRSLEEATDKRDTTYLTILDDCLKEETSPKMKRTLKKFQDNLEQEREHIDEYILGRYDKNHETYRLKKWIRDFNKNGFSLTGGIISFKPSYYKGKQPIDLINDDGEFLKQGKASLKGKAYTMEVD